MEKLNIESRELVAAASKAVDTASQILLTATTEGEFHDSLRDTYNYPVSALRNYIWEVLVRVLPQDPSTYQYIHKQLLRTYDSASKSWEFSALATARGLKTLIHIDPLSDELSGIVRFLFSQCEKNATWKAELPGADDPAGDSRFVTSEILAVLNHAGVLRPEEISQRATPLTDFFLNTPDQDLLRPHAAYTAVPLYNLFMLGVVSFDRSPYEQHWLRFLIDLDFFRNSRKRADTVLETVYILKLLLRTALLSPDGKIKEAIKWLLEVRIDGGWNRQAYNPPSGYVTAKVVDVLCDYIEFQDLKERAVGYLASSLPGTTSFLAGTGQEKTRLAAIWDAVDWKLKVPGIGISVDVKKLLKI